MADERENIKNTRNLSPELLEKARVELNEIQSEVPEHIEALRERILADPTINFRTDDSFLLRFLRARKFDQEQAFELMTNYYMQREYYSNLFSTTKSDFEKVLDQHAMGALPDRDANGRAIILLLDDRWDQDKIPIELIIFQYLLTLENLIEDEAIQINGAVWILDLSEFNVSQAAQTTPWKMKEAASVLINHFPMHLHEIHFLNVPSIFYSVYSIIKLFLSKDLKKRVFFHDSSLSSLHQNISPEVLPKELKGDLEAADFTYWNKVLLKNFDRITEGFECGFVPPPNNTGNP